MSTIDEDRNTTLGWSVEGGAKRSVATSFFTPAMVVTINIVLYDMGWDGKSFRGPAQPLRVMPRDQLYRNNAEKLQTAFYNEPASVVIRATHIRTASERHLGLGVGYGRPCSKNVLGPFGISNISVAIRISIGNHGQPKRDYNRSDRLV